MKVIKDTLLKLVLMLSVVFVVSCEEYLPDGELFAKGYLPSESVDLGLPSGLKWATYNVGASSPEEYGGYYAWGETEEKENYSWSTYKWCNGSYDTMTKYCTSSGYGTVDNKTVLDPEDDVAHVKWGGSWRMPTEGELDELYNNCTWSWTIQNGVEGYKVTGSNGNSIFLPAAGYRLGTGVSNTGTYGYYWSSSLDNSDYADILYFYRNTRSRNRNYRYYGFPVRPVCDDGIAPVAKYTISVGCDVGGNVAISGNSGTSATFETGVSVTVVATPDEGYAFSGWYVNNALVSTDAEYTFTVSEDVALLARFEKTGINVHEYVDLGLPSGLKWATCNVGASSPEEYGGYYDWGETEEKEYYYWSTYKWCNGSYNTMTKYCTDSYYGTVDNKTTLDLEDDVAHVKWGGSWRMPTESEQRELLNNCTWTWTTQNGVEGYKVTGSNGNSIFLPAAGYRLGTGVSNTGTYGYYWSSSLDNSDYSSNCTEYAYILYTHRNTRYRDKYYRYYGFPVRPVCD